MSEGNRKLFKLFGGAAALFCTLLIALSFKIYYALETHQPVMTGDYYEIGRNFDEYRRNHQNSADRSLQSALLEKPAQNMLYHPALRTGTNSVSVLYQQAPADQAQQRPLAGAQIEFVLSRKATVNDNVSARCVTDQSGRCELNFALPAGGYWEGRLEAIDDNGRILERRVYEIEG